MATNTMDSIKAYIQTLTQPIERDAIYRHFLTKDDTITRGDVTKALKEMGYVTTRVKVSSGFGFQFIPRVEFPKVWLNINFPELTQIVCPNFVAGGEDGFFYGCRVRHEGKWHQMRVGNAVLGVRKAYRGNAVHRRVR